MIDIHCHIVPGLDDGSKSWEMTLAMCRLALADGIRHIVATPHSDDTYAYDRDRVREAVVELDRHIGNQLQFSIGCDFHLSYENIEDAIAHPQRYTIGGKQYLLVEFSDFGIPPRSSDPLVRLQSAGMVPIITHPERNAILQRQPERVLDWVAAGSLVQVTASALTGMWGGTAKKIALWLLEQQAVHVLATDAHDDKRRTPILSAARNFVCQHFDRHWGQSLVESNPAAIIAGRPLGAEVSSENQPHRTAISAESPAPVQVSNDEESPQVQPARSRDELENSNRAYEIRRGHDGHRVRVRQRSM